MATTYRPGTFDFWKAIVTPKKKEREKNIQILNVLREFLIQEYPASKIKLNQVNIAGLTDQEFKNKIEVLKGYVKQLDAEIKTESLNPVKYRMAFDMQPKGFFKLV